MNDRPFLSIITRTCQRPKMLSENIASVKAQTCHDVEQLFLVDHTRKGIQAADRALHEHGGQVRGRYVYILDDDGILIHDAFVEMVKGVVEDNSPSPSVVMVKSRRPPGPPSMQPIVPTPQAWNSRNLYHGACNCLCYVMEATLWRTHIKQFGVKPWGGDWWTLASVLATNPTMYWLDEIVADCRQLGRGKLFETDKADWFAPVAREHNLERITNDIWRMSLWTREQSMR